jgi:hypothetical protein
VALEESRAKQHLQEVAQQHTGIGTTTAQAHVPTHHDTGRCATEQAQAQSKHGAGTAHHALTMMQSI